MKRATIDPEDLPTAGGAYALSLRLSQPAELPLARLNRPTLAPGRYLYCGSAYGPGGLRARLRRHLAIDKPMHWHIDHLRRLAEIDDLLFLPGGNECALVARFATLPGSSIPLPGFGSSDCRRCAAHLLAVAGDLPLHR